ncbi:putative ABC transport system ATP-binding protein [Caldicellulosiruptor bescii]|uniref:ABC transporter related n=2 Tax=Caldicellulosiruptor bescii TaxID=31899 RepID=B9MMR8_CALBD|nr:ABC transporter ATP-binding protein [Caldicellulosiruptor bescii]ACM61367.1 ABC transporter related [Caldicellulosiruptor bescii DSM 6725]PBC88820.1 putative ABC transport system ATP-binding protein [Caldicellulosiruptor bescii]PBC91698.1 putative ABC transport system ATP-binding protein [Caldicellulosiruptor bescii]PBD02889.1 putative ABC transport system ATP-binding protein [Caldicellulosiruptor bescii]PBD07494.1 putative ABC transport system ATP-binding protein [Caldicellulosiruptor besc
MIELYDIYKIYKMGENEVYALNGINLKINVHEFVAIVGPSGSGKSTLMNIIGCLDTPTSGTYILDSHEVSRLNDNQLAEIRNSKIGFVFQNFNLIPQLTALENVELPLIYKGVPASVRHKLAKEALARVGLEHRMHHRPRELSGGQQQRVAIARALVTSPPIILADEPTGNLDSKSGAEIMQIFKELHAQGNTIVLITHDNNIAMQARRIVRIQDGQIIEDKEVS